MTPDLGSERRLLALIDRALELPAPERELFLRQECGSDAGLFEAAQALLAACREVEESDAGHPPELMGAINQALADRYHLLRPIGRGGNAVVYLARETHHQREVAIKVIYPGVPDAGRRRRFLREISIVAGLRHPFIVPLLDSGEAAEQLYYVMPYMAGESLRERLDREGPLPEADAIAIAHDVGEALDQAHTAGIVHRDITPQNILLSGGHALVADFGVALALESDANDRVTSEGTVVGTPGYMSPEQASGSSEVDGRSDVYALGCVLYEMLTGEIPYPGDTPRAIIAKHLQAPVPDVSVLRPQSSPGIPSALKRAMAKVPADRFQSAGKLVASLTRASGRTGQLPARKPDRLLLVSTIGIVLAGMIGGAFLLTRSPGAPVIPVLAVGTINQVPARDSGELSPLSDLLATSIARLPALQVLSNARLIEVEQSLVRGGSRPSASEVARRAQATQLLDGTVYRRGADSLVLELHQTDLKTGRLLHGYRVEAADVFALVDRATAEIARAADVARPAQGIADVTTGSLIALRLYQEGLQTYYASDYAAARRFFAAAVAEDSTFAMAMWYLGRADQAMLDPVGRLHFLAALRLASGASERERLLITADVMRADLRSTAVAIAETLASRYPSDPEGLLMLGLSQASSSNSNAVATIRRAMALDSAVPAGRGRACRPCDSYRALTYAYAWEDSLPAAFATAWDFVRLLPNETTAWTMLSEVANLLGDTLTIDSAQRTFERLTGRTPGVGIDGRLTGKIVRGDYLSADTALLALGAVSNELRSDLRWYLTISLRNQGRLDAAIALSREGTLPAGGADRTWRMPVDSILLSIALFERGDPGFCRRLYRGLATKENPELRDWPGTAARERTWALTRLAMCRAAYGDTTGFARLADSLKTIGANSLYGRDQRVHHYVRGLLWKARGKPEQAVAEFQAAISSPNFGFTRINYELGGLLLQLGRPGDAVAILQPALRGALDASNLYITRTELHELLAKAWEAAGNADSARAHWRAVERSWRGADPQFRARYEVARAKASGSK